MNVPDWFAGLSSPLDEKLGVELLEVTPNRAVGRAPVAGNTQPFGLWHGGASCVLAEGLASLAAAAEVGPRGAVTGVDINATHLRPAREGWVTGVATAIRIGGTLATYDISLTDDAGEQVCAARITVYLKRAPGAGATTS
ncbi:Putative esterase [Propionicimonas sp. T2.31MG-18]|uniref:PaaI family thioesterase n=1 Tax=Propionicimonas sp. T2.31MG-18 TaxID=3157620 RepID=UPI0035EFE183